MSECTAAFRHMQALASQPRHEDPAIHRRERAHVWLPVGLTDSLRDGRGSERQVQRGGASRRDRRVVTRPACLFVPMHSEMRACPCVNAMLKRAWSRALDL